MKKALRYSVSGRADRCKALEAHPPPEDGAGVPYGCQSRSLLEQPHEDYTAYVEKGY